MSEVIQGADSTQVVPENPNENNISDEIIETDKGVTTSDEGQVVFFPADDSVEVDTPVEPTEIPVEASEEVVEPAAEVPVEVAPEEITAEPAVEVPADATPAEEVAQ